VDGEWTRDGLGMDWRWTGQGVEGLKVDWTRTPWTRGGLHRDSTRISGGVINTASFTGSLKSNRMGWTSRLLAEWIKGTISWSETVVGPKMMFC